MNTYSMIYQKYEHGLGHNDGIKTVEFSAPNDKAALLIAHPRISHGCGNFSRDSIAINEEYIKHVTVEALKKNIEGWNGDMCDILLQLINKTTGETLYEENSAPEIEGEEEFSEDLFKGLL